ncbi:unnamed protein product [Medioppia subpectinata]|uniref:Spermatogenesis-associated protein 6 N-terminal domain-containing protein n=1 Tax=Medioppia subpectinata TaxID=1979941 RepID=A0A7R9LP12_9ACAR|nr:unnamed protein product [Medioppia subpectinata]CAG2119937.1 unnamed protein product [Medioppia subpectinata]
MRILTDIQISMISCPGVRISSYKTKLYLRIKLFNCLAISSQFKPKFPVILYEHFYFDQHFDSRNNKQLLDLLSDQELVIELMDEKNLILCKYESKANDFLYPRPQLRPKYSQSSRSLLMDCCLLPIAPKLEFNIINTITEDVEECDTDIDINTLESDSIESDLESEENSPLQSLRLSSKSRYVYGGRAIADGRPLSGSPPEVSAIGLWIAVRSV